MRPRSPCTLIAAALIAAALCAAASADLVPEPTAPARVCLVPVQTCEPSKQIGSGVSMTVCTTRMVRCEDLRSASGPPSTCIS